MPIKYFILIITVLILAAVVDSIRREKMTFKYAVNWFLGGIAAIVFALNEQWIFKLAQWAGFSLPSNFIFFLLLVFVIFLSLRMTLFINEQNSRAEALAQAVARLENEISQLKKNGK